MVIPVGEPGAGLAHDAGFDTHVNDRAFARNALAVDDVEFSLLERRSHLVLDHLGARTVSDRRTRFLESFDATHIDAHRGVELQGLTAGRGLRGTEKHADLFTQLVDEDRGRAGRREGTRDLTQGLAHEAGLQAHVGVAHLALNFCLGHQGRDRVDDDNVDAARADQHVGNFEGLLARVGLRDQQGIGVHAQGASVDGVERVLSVDEGRVAAGLLGVRNGVQSNRGFTGGFGAVDLNDTPAG